MSKRTMALRALSVSLLCAVMLPSAVAFAQNNQTIELLTGETKPKNQLVAETTSEKKSEKPSAAAEPTPAVKPAPAPAPVLVTVALGDSLSSIAAAHNTTWVRLFNANESIVHPDIINPGQQVRIPTAEETLVDRPLPLPPAPAPAPVVQPTYSSAPARAAAPARTYAAAPAGGGSAKAFIYSKESGNNPAATNPSGCYGLGQDCNGVLRSQCGADYACQDAYFDSYAARRYGSWEAAQSFWLANGWW